MKRACGLLCLLGSLLAAACAPSSGPGLSSQAPAERVGAGRTLIFVHGGENLSFLDDRSLPYAVLAESVPEFGTSSWQLLPDGKMEITYRLKPNLTWHDGQPLTADDWAFAWRVYSNPVFGIASSGGLRYIDDVV